ncbi:hypothetical protein DERF_002686 [Dermatophagoides farinae]|uniref:Uncharacterized protein n=1 Tax=Dermatophagoides farinae TaxID=6954 RepID=A0A922ICW0_DERFA|nr:hypothetical protein DERF_002686 [Dermatophagoides farinae]
MPDVVPPTFSWWLSHKAYPGSWPIRQFYSDSISDDQPGNVATISHLSSPTIDCHSRAATFSISNHDLR